MKQKLFLILFLACLLSFNFAMAEDKPEDDCPCGSDEHGECLPCGTDGDNSL